MLLKLVRKDEMTILSGIDSVSTFYQDGDNERTKVLSVVFKDEKPTLNFVLSEETEKDFVIVQNAYLMNEKGETIERLN